MLEKFIKWTYIHYIGTYGIRAILHKKINSAMAATYSYNRMIL